MRYCAEMTKKNIRVVVVDDHALFRAGIISLLSQMTNIQVVGEGSNGLEAIELVSEKQPEILLLDVSMPVLNGVDTLRKIKNISSCRILMLTISRRQEDLLNAIQAGADGYILKNAEPEELYNAIISTSKGHSVLSPEITSKVMDVVRKASSLGNPDFDITSREMDVLALLHKKQTNPQISDQLNISENTVKTHVRNLMEKLNVTSRSEAVRKALTEGILIGSPDSFHIRGSE